MGDNSSPPAQRAGGVNDDVSGDDSGWWIRLSRTERLERAMRRRWPAVQMAVDATAWIIAIVATTFLRYDLRLDPINERGVVLIALLAAGLQLVAGFALGLYRRRFHYGSLEEVRVLASTMAIVALVTFAAVRAFGEGSLVPRSVPLLGGFVAIVVASIVRFTARLVEDLRLRPDAARSEPIVVVGAGRAARQIVRSLLGTPDSPYRPVALVDDNPQKGRLQFNGVKVEGLATDAIRVAHIHGATAVLVAITGISGERLQQLADAWGDHDLDVLILPPMHERLGQLTTADIRPLTINDLLGRHPAAVDTDEIAGYVTGRRVLVTGAGGSIGSELCRQLSRYGPASLLMLDRDESGLHNTQLSIEGRALLDSPNLLLADIRDRERVFEVFRQHRPEVVFHAAALKHLPLLEFNPSEGWKTNVVGTNNVLEAAQATGVDRFVNVSTDKAADPENVLGFVKRICERMTAAVAAETGRNYVSVRFGNVLGSRGSMLGTFEEQLRNDLPITVTHPEVTRYFMTIEEAVALTIQAAAIGEPGEVMVLDMGEPVRIEDVARRLADEVGKDPQITYTGLRPGEKLHEVLLAADEVDRRPNHPLISQIAVAPLAFQDARAACSVNGRLLLSRTTLELAVSAEPKVADRDGAPRPEHARGRE